MMKDVFIGLGSNVGDRQDSIKKAIGILASDKMVQIESVSSIFETSPYGVEAQDSFMNAVIKIETSYSPLELLKKTKSIEQSLGRTHTFRWGPRKIDLDILLYGDRVVETETLSIPHKDMLHRDFVMVPLLEIEPEAYHPLLNSKIKNLDLDFANEKHIIGKSSWMN